MANRKRYREVEQLLTRVLIADAVVFALFLLFSGLGLTALKVITAIIAILASLLCLAFLYMSGELMKRRSRWLVVGFGCIVICLLFSLILRYPAPSAKTASGASATTSSTFDTAGNTGTTGAAGTSASGAVG